MSFILVIYLFMLKLIQTKRSSRVSHSGLHQNRDRTFSIFSTQRNHRLREMPTRCFESECAFKGNLSVTVH